MTDSRVENNYANQRQAEVRLIATWMLDSLPASAIDVLLTRLAAARCESDEHAQLAGLLARALGDEEFENG